MLKRILPVLLALAVLLTACGGEPAEPTMSAADVQGTAVAAAWTMVAATQQAIPTATLPPPTEIPSPTPLPTFTQPALLFTPTTSFAIPPTATQPSDPDSCLHPLDMGQAGKTRRARVENISGGTVFSLSLNLYQKNAFGQCGTLTVLNIGKNDKPIVNLPTGFWWGYAWIDYKDGSHSTSEGSWEVPVGGGDDLFRLIINRDSIGFKGP